MRELIFITAFSAVCFCIVQSTAAVDKFTAVGIYDDDEQVNAVDKSASYNATYSTGMGRKSGLILAIDDFSPLVLEVFTNNHGGVINFDNGLIESGQQADSFAALFGGKALLFKSVDHIRSDYTSSSRTPISGPGKSPNGGFLAKSTVKGDACTIGGSYQFELTEYGFGPDEHVRVVTGTILGRNGSDKNGEWTMKVTLDNGDIVAASAVLDIASGNTSDDTFFGAFAPSGRYITGVAWTSYSGEFSGLDDVGFITSTEDFSLPKTEVVAKAKVETPAVETPMLGSPTTSNPNALTFFGIPISTQRDDSDDDSSSGTSSVFGSDRPSYR